MSIISKFDEILQFNDDNVAKVRQYFNIDARQIEQYVEILKNWLKQQQHLPQDVDDGFLERMLVRNKFRIEQTKRKLDDYYTIRAHYPQYIRDDYKNLRPSEEIRQFFPLPKLTNAQERIIYSFKQPEDTERNLPNFITLINAMLEFTLHHDYSIGDRFIFDFKYVPFSDTQLWTITIMSHLYKLYTKAYSGRILSIDIINPPSHMNIFMNLIKMVLPEKIFSRIKLHNDLDSLHQSVPKECLPADLGGDLNVTIEELSRRCDKLFVEYYEFFNEVTKKFSNEKLRIGDCPQTEELYGIEGNFRQLDID